MLSTEQIKTILSGVGYHADAATLQAVRALLAQRAGARALLVQGPPGTGKTALAEALAKGLGAEYVFAMLHPWSGADDLFGGVDVRAAVAGDPDHVHVPGVLARAAELSHTHELVVVCLDELDKPTEQVEDLLLDWLQNGRVPLKPGEHLQTRLDRVIVILTSNGTRPHREALIRRCRRLWMAPMDAALRVRLAAERSGAPIGVVRLIDRAAQAIAEAEGNEGISLQEITRAAEEIWLVADSHDMVTEALRCWIARTQTGADAVARGEIRRLVAAIWGEVCAARRQGG